LQERPEEARAIPSASTFAALSCVRAFAAHHHSHHMLVPRLLTSGTYPSGDLQRGGGGGLCRDLAGGDSCTGGYVKCLHSGTSREAQKEDGGKRTTPASLPTAEWLNNVCLRPLEPAGAHFFVFLCIQLVARGYASQPTTSCFTLLAVYAVLDHLLSNTAYIPTNSKGPRPPPRSPSPPPLTAGWPRVKREHRALQVNRQDRALDEREAKHQEVIVEVGPRQIDGGHDWVTCLVGDTWWRSRRSCGGGWLIKWRRRGRRTEETTR